VLSKGSFAAHSLNWATRHVAVVPPVPPPPPPPPSLPPISLLVQYITLNINKAELELGQFRGECRISVTGAHIRALLLYLLAHAVQSLLEHLGKL
jgi:hypothetical protein